MIQYKQYDNCRGGKLKYFIYTFFFEQEKYIKLEKQEKYLLCLMYMYSDNKGKLLVTQTEICKIANAYKSLLTDKKKKFIELGFILPSENDEIFMKIPNDVKSVNKIEINEEFIIGRYKHLDNGTKLFYAYCLYMQKNQNEKYIEYSNDEIKAPFAGSINTIKKYCNELQKEHLLIRVRTSVSHSYHFKEIE